MGKWLRTALVCIVSLAALHTAGCVSMSRNDATFYRQCEEAGLNVDVGKAKDPTAAACLNILPGIGNFYLASGTGEGPQVLYGVLNLLAWPISVVWAVPQAAIDANTINKLETVYYYRHNEDGKAALAAAKARPSAETTTETVSAQ